MLLKISQKGFLLRFVVVVSLLLAGLLLIFIADSRNAGMETAAGMDNDSWLKMLSGWMFLGSSVMSIITLRYGSRHEVAIREHKSLSHLLTAYRTLFWLSVVSSLIAAVILAWFVMHLGPVR
jgi:hypothetical protein